MDERIRDIKIERDDDGNVVAAMIEFGPHYFVDIRPNGEGVLTLYLGATHHGFAADATEIGKGLEEIIGEVRDKHPDLAFG